MANELDRGVTLVWGNRKATVTEYQAIGLRQHLEGMTTAGVHLAADVLFRRFKKALERDPGERVVILSEEDRRSGVGPYDLAKPLQDAIALEEAEHGPSERLRAVLKMLEHPPQQLTSESDRPAP